MTVDDENKTGEAFVEKVPITKAFGLHPRTRIVAAMLSERDDGLAAFTESELRRIADVDEPEYDEAIAALREQNLVVEADEDEIPEGPAYRLDHGNRAVDAIIDLNDELSEHLQS